MTDQLTVKRPRNAHSRYHAHVYFDEATQDDARRLCDGAAAQFGAAVGRMHRRPVGPHPHWSCQLSFDSAQFDALVPWLEAHRAGLNILVHGVTGNHLEDHTTHAYWLGTPSRLDLSVFETSAGTP